MRANISKAYTTYKLQPKVLKLVLNFPPNGPPNTMFGSFDILSFRFLAIFFFKNFKFTIVAYGKIKKPPLSGKRAIVEQRGVKFGTRGK